MNSQVWEGRADEVAIGIVGFAFERPAMLGSTRLVSVDGRAGAGKTTLGGALHRVAVERGSARLLHMDDMYEGWSGLAEVSARVQRDLVAPLRDDRPGRYQRYDWHQQRFVEWHTVGPVDLLILEGVGSGARTYVSALTALVWVEAPRELRLARGIERDGLEVLPRWLTWMDDEDALFDREGTRARADVIVDGTGTASAPTMLG